MQLFESTANFLICGLLLLLWKRRQFPGQIFLIYLMLYGCMRFILEYFRGDIDRGVWFGGRLSTSQIIALGVIAVAVIAWKYARPRPQVTRGARSAHI